MIGGSSGELADVVGVAEGDGEEEGLVSFLFEELGRFVREVGVFGTFHGGVAVNLCFIGIDTDVPFPKVGAIVPGSGECPAEHGEGSIDVHAVGDNAGFVGMAARLDACAAGLAEAGCCRPW